MRTAVTSRIQNVGEQVTAVGILVAPMVVDGPDAATTGPARDVGDLNLTQDVAYRLLAKQIRAGFQQFHPGLLGGFPP